MIEFIPEITLLRMEPNEIVLISFGCGIFVESNKRLFLFIRHSIFQIK